VLIRVLYPTITAAQASDILFPHEGRSAPASAAEPANG
jgi:hypothetical protein